MSASCPPTEPHWHLASAQAWRLPRELAPWLMDQGSLTARLQAHSDGQFAVTLLRQGWGPARTSELRLLDCRPGEKILVREVILCGRGQPWVFARSLVPYTSLTGRLKALRKLDNRPLGALLFQDPGMTRDPLALASIEPKHQYVDAGYQPDQPLWGRRSLFYLDGQPLMVSEVFLPAFLATL